MSNDFGKATALTADLAAEKEVDAFQARAGVVLSPATAGTLYHCMKRVYDWGRLSALSAPAPAEPHTDFSALKEDIKRRLAIAFDASSTGIWRDATNLMVKTIDENAAPRPARPDVGEAVAWMFWNEPDTQRHLSVLEPGNHWSTRIPLYAHQPPAASSAARVADLETALKLAAMRLRGVSVGNARNGLTAAAAMAALWAEDANTVARSPAAPEPKS